ncbi:hypothetical protein PROFUN_00541 [Planoprotostelium fungivorum]|uniref:Uncharacterized protein n=1 Tax=Planoprotostelium fungivorum TaxID=1890364 RepID=A0A2P6N1A2_9EUKA|nr:hypothetical protein PROFUN_00541 [Planoprotostelium fungivorum]
MSVSLKLIIRGPSAATKFSGLVVQVQFTNNTGRAVSGKLTFQLKDMITNDILPPTNSGVEVTVPADGLQQNFTLGDFFNTTKTGAYHTTASFEGNSSNDLMVKLLL